MTEHSHDFTDETLRLVTSVQDWARRSFPTEPEHATSDCQWCPLCQFVAVLRGERPEVTAKVAEAGSAVVTAMRAFLDAAVDAAGQPSTARHAAPAAEAETSRPASSTRPRVQRIDLSAES